MSLKYFTALCLAWCFLTHAALAQRSSGGSIGHGGGKAIQCIEGHKEKIYLADTFELVRSGAVEGLEKVDPSYIMSGIEELLERKYPEKTYPHPYLPGQKVSFAWIVTYTHANLGFVYSDRVPEIDDDNIDESTLPDSCRKLQLAVLDFQTGVVQEQFSLIRQLSLPERGFFELHETFNKLRNQPGADTTPIRKQVAAVLEDPEFSLRNILTELVKPLRKDPFADPTWAKTYLQSNSCAQNPEEKFCKIANELVRSEWRLADEATSLPTLIRVPEELHCRLTHVSKNYYAWYPGNFTVRRVSGSGRPREKSVYSFSMPSPDPQYMPKSLQAVTRAIPPKKVFYPQSENSFVSTHRHMPAISSGIFGNLNINITWKVKGEGPREKQWPDSRTLFIYKYYHRTGEFTGNLQMSDEKFDGKYSSFGVTCSAVNPEFGLDMEQSFY